MKIVVGGCRGFNDYESFCISMNKLMLKYPPDDTVIISGHCSGVDMMGERFAAEKSYKIMIFEADWKRYGRAAGPIRNKLMVKNADMVIAFWDGHSRGTKSLIGLTEKMGKPIEIIRI